MHKVRHPQTYTGEVYDKIKFYHELRPYTFADGVL